MAILAWLALSACRTGSSAPPAALAQDERTARPAHESLASSAADKPAEPAAARAAPAPASSAPARDAKRLAVFFSGHSLLDNPMPDWVELIATSRGHSLAWEQQIVLGSPIRVRTKGDDPEHSGWPGYRLGKSKDGESIDVLAELKQPTRLAGGEHYQRLLITERNDFLGAVKWENTADYLRDYHERLLASGAGNASTLLYQCWPEVDRGDANAWIRYVRSEALAWQCLAAKVNHTLKAAGRRPGVSVVPGGLALAELVERALSGNVGGLIGNPRQRLDRIFTDDVHLTAIGTYLLSALHYGALFGQSPIGAAAPPEVPAELVPFLQRIAWDTLENAAPAQPSLAECRQRVATEVCPAYHRRRGKPDEAASCGFWASPESPLSEAAASKVN